MSAVPLDRVSKILSSVKAQQLLTVIDACRNNPETGRSGEDNVQTDDFSIVEFLLVADLAKQDCIVSFWADIEYLLFFA